MSRCLSSIELFTLNASFGAIPDTPAYVAYPQLALIDKITFRQAYVLIGAQLSTAANYTGAPAANGPMGVSLVAAQAVPEISFSNSMRAVFTHMFFQASDTKDNWVPLEENGLVIPSNTALSLYGFGDGGFKLAATCNLYLVRI